MNDQLMTLNKIFNDRIFRIPDYQRGYAWTIKEVKEFWNDLMRLGKGKNHYVGVLTLEPVLVSEYTKWIDDLWIIESRRYSPYYVVDGQQRLTTSILLIKTIISTMSEKGIDKLNYSSNRDITRQFIVESKDENKSNTYLFGYEEANPSYTYLVNQIYNGKTVTLANDKETTYTLNLKNAMTFFQSSINKMELHEIEEVYKKITQHFVFNTYEISSDIDVFVTFETMNNRGKPLSHLELLKNRLIYLATLFDVSSDITDRLRRDINYCWKNIYHVLGQGKSNYLPDDEFLDAHFHLYFCDNINDIYKSSRNRNNRYLSPNEGLYNYLLDVYFVVSKISSKELVPNDVIDYINSLNESINIWCIINTPENSDYNEEIVEYLKKLNYLLNPKSQIQMRQMQFFQSNRNKILLLACLQINNDDKILLKFLKSFEKYLFLMKFIPFECYYGDFERSNLEIIDILKKLRKGDMVVSGVKEKIDKIINSITTDEVINKKLISYYNNNGFYSEDFQRYFLCEYEIHLQNICKSHVEKLNRDIYFSKGYDSIEHIYPQRARKDYWISQFVDYTQKQRSSLRGSLGNFVAVSSVKNGRLANLPFPEKRDGGSNHIGYRYGTYAEIELTNFENWGAKEILNRGLTMVTFLQDRWGYKIGNNKKDKIAFLGLSFLSNK